MADIVIVLVLITAAFMLGSYPFSLWIGSLRLHKDIRSYGDGNPSFIFHHLGTAFLMLTFFMVWHGVPLAPA